MKASERPFTLLLDDPAGNSYIEFLSSSEALDDLKFTLGSSEALDPLLSLKRYIRSAEQNISLGFSTETPSINATEKEIIYENTDVDSVFEFGGTCPVCLAVCPTRMHPINIPYFKEVIIMATTCSICNYKSSEVKSGGAISALGRRIIFILQTPEDLSRDILKSETCSILIPEIGLELAHGTLGGKFTTVEGLLLQIKEEMQEKVPFTLGDSSTPAQMTRFQTLIQELDAIIKCTNLDKGVTLIIDDPLSNSYLQSFYAPDPDPQILIEDYERTLEQQDQLGLTHFSVD